MSLRTLLDLLPARKSPVTELTLGIGSRSVSVALKRRKQARRMTLRMDRSGDGAILTIPQRLSLAEAKAFLERSRPWLDAQLGKQKSRVVFAEGNSVPLRGVAHSIATTGQARGLVSVDHALAKITVPGGPAHIVRRLTDFLKREAMADLNTATAHYATAMGVTVNRIAVRDQKSRWGSCTSTGVISYSWRLILAPPFVLDYVAAHEVAHLLEMNHSARYWRHVLKHCPRTREARNWLKAHGGDLHRYG